MRSCARAKGRRWGRYEMYFAESRSNASAQERNAPDAKASSDAAMPGVRSQGRRGAGAEALHSVWVAWEHP